MTGKVIIFILPLLGIAGACHPVEPPTVRACVALLADAQTLAKMPLQTCRCADEIARRQLDPDAYRLATDLAEATLADRSAAQKGRSAANSVIVFRRRVGPLNSAIAATDLATLAAKATSRCF